MVNKFFINQCFIWLKKGIALSFIIYSIAAFIIFFVGVFTKRFWEKNIISLQVVLLSISTLKLTFVKYPVDDFRFQIFNSLLVLGLDICVSMYILKTKFADICFSDVVQNKKSLVTLIIFIIVASFFLFNFTLKSEEKNIYNVLNSFLFLFGSCIEEYILRGIVFLKVREKEKKVERWTYYFVLSVLFTLAHYPKFKTDFSVFILIFTLSFVLFAIRELWSSKYSFSLVCFLHMLYNFVAVVWDTFFNNY